MPSTTAGIIIGERKKPSARRGPESGNAQWRARRAPRAARRCVAAANASRTDSQNAATMSPFSRIALEPAQRRAVERHRDEALVGERDEHHDRRAARG